MTRIITSHPTGNANTRGAVDGFCRAGLLQSFHTCVACFPNSLMYLLARGPLSILRRRTFSAMLRRLTHTYPLREVMRMLSPKLRLKSCLEHEKGMFCIDKVYSSLDGRVARYMRRHAKDIDGVYAFEDCAIEQFRAAKELGKVCVYDLPASYWRTWHKLLEDERKSNPDWAMTLGCFYDSREKLARKDAEIGLADRIVVASSFTRWTLSSYPGTIAPIDVVPYGFPEVNTARIYKPFEGRRVKLLFVGGMSQGKGLSYLFQALEGLEDKIDVTMVGRGNIDICPALKSALRRVHYIPSLPHEEVLQLMAEHDVLAFPSLAEGFGLVVTEAMSQGTPVIATDRTCGPDVITHGKDGWIVKAGEAEAIRQLLLEFIENPQQLQVAGREAMRTAAARPWSVYEAELSNIVKRTVDGSI